MKAVIADSGPLYAQVDPGDEYHSRVREETKRIVAGGFQVVVAQPVVLETYSLILRRLNVPRALDWLDWARRSCGLVNPTSGDYAEASEALTRFDDQPISLFDAVTARLSVVFDYPVWTYDHHFDVMGVEVWRDGE